MVALSEESRVPPYLREILEKFEDAGVELNGLTPLSTWFSYGSNLCRADFERKMIMRRSSLSLLRARRASLTGWMRRLDNESSTRGLAYSIGPGPSTSTLEGIVHDVPVDSLLDFLQSEGILDREHHLKGEEGPNRRRYDIRKITVQVSAGGDSKDCYVLVGRCTLVDEFARANRARGHRSDLTDYIRVSIRGAADFGIDKSSFEDDLLWVESLRAL